MSFDDIFFFLFVEPLELVFKLRTERVTNLLVQFCKFSFVLVVNDDCDIDIDIACHCDVSVIFLGRSVVSRTVGSGRGIRCVENGG